MNNQPWMENEALLDLLAKRATEGLEPSEALELDRLLEAHGGVPAAEIGFESVVAHLDVAFAANHDEPVPAKVMMGLRELGERFCASEFSDADGSPAAEPELKPELKLAGSRAEASVPPASGASGVLAWGGWVAAAACLLIAAVAWWPGGAGPVDVPALLTLAEQVESLKARPGAITLSWVGLDDAGLAAEPNVNDQDLRGEVVWDDATNEGFMVFEGLASNDPTAMQYQLWIFDTERRLGDLPHFDPGGLPILTQRPVDGGVFDAVPTGEGGKVIVPIRAKLPVGHAAVFAVTAEPPGGVVVSDRDIVTLALVPQG